MHPKSLLCPLCQSVTDLIAADADVLEVPVAEMAQRDKRCLTLAMRDHGGNRPVDEAAEARQKKRRLLFGLPERSPRRVKYC